MKEITFNSLADFKRKATVGAYLKGGYNKYHSGNYIDEWREIVKAQSNGVSLKTNNLSGRSFFDFPKARDCEIENEGGGSGGSVLKIYEERVRTKDNNLGNEYDHRADFEWVKWHIEQGDFEVLERYRKQVAEYRLGVK